MVGKDELITKTLKSCGKNSNAAWGTLKGEIIALQTGSICFASLREKPKQLRPDMLCNVIQKHYPSKVVGGLVYDRSKNPERFLDYLMNRSVFKDCYLEHDAAKATELGYTLHTTDVNAVMFMACLTLQRVLTEEDTSTGQFFSDMVDTGIPEEFAILVGHHLKHNGRLGFTRNSNHSLFLDYIEIEQAVNFLNKKVVLPHNLSYKDGGSTFGVHSLFSAARPETLDAYYSGDKENTRTFWFNSFLIKHADAQYEERVCPLSGKVTKESIYHTLDFDKLPEIYEAFKKEYM